MKIATFLHAAVLLAVLAVNTESQAQSVLSSTISVKVSQVAVLNTADCDNVAGDSDFAWHFLAFDNSLGYGNNTPTDSDFMGSFNFGFRDGNNGPYSMAPADGTVDSGWDPGDGVFFNHFYCGDVVPTAITINWRGYENDATGDYSTTNSPDGNTGVQVGSINVPATTGTVTQQFTASGSSGTCPQNYSISFEVSRTDVMAPAPIDMTICQGDSMGWYGVFYNATGMYDEVFTSQSGCDSIMTLHLTVNPVLTADVSIATTTGDTACFGEAVIFTATPSNAGSNPSYQWFLDGQNLGVVNSSFGTTALANGQVVLCVMTVDTFCVADSTVSSNAVQMTINVCSGVNETPMAADFWSVYPNPANDFISIANEQLIGAVELRLYSLSGQLIQANNINNLPYALDVQALKTGLYYLQLVSEQGVYTQKVAVDRH